MNVTFGLIEDTSHSPIRDRAERRRRMVERALAAIRDWRAVAEREPASSFELPASSLSLP
jgi:folate-dependent tRNA-U54 methylase TrmFO/GidA